MVLELEGARYKGQGFVIQHHQDLAKLRQLFGPGKHYDQIASGMDSDHIRSSASPVLRAKWGNDSVLVGVAFGPRPGGVLHKT